MENSAVTLRRISDSGKVYHVSYDGTEQTSLPQHDSFYEKMVFLQDRFACIPPRAFYRFLFPSGSLERLGHQEDKKPNAIILELREDLSGKTTGRKKVLTDGLEQLESALEAPCAICSPISYYGKSRKASNALYMHALTLDIDYVGIRELTNLVYWSEIEVIPRPTFIVNSGHGVHLYYVFEEPIPMFKENQKELRKLKAQLIRQIWTDYTSYDTSTIETLGVVQGFRMVGSRSKRGNFDLTAHQTGDRVTLDYLNGFVMPEHQANIKEKHGLTLHEAKVQYPDWYQRVVVEGQKPGRWHVKRDLYDWYKRRIETETTYGHRYFCMMCLAIYAMKCDISREELEKDALRFQKIFNEIQPDKPFTIEETFKALEVYNEEYVTFPRDSISRVTALAMAASKRNKRKQEVHLMGARAIQEINDRVNGTNWREGNGRPVGSGTKEQQIKDYAAANPGLSNRQIAAALGVSRNTVNKWLK